MERRNSCLWFGGNNIEKNKKRKTTSIFPPRPRGRTYAQGGQLKMFTNFSTSQRIALVLIIVGVLLTACGGASQEAIQTAIAQTQVATTTAQAEGTCPPAPTAVYGVAAYCDASTGWKWVLSTPAAAQPAVNSPAETPMPEAPDAIVSLNYDRGDPNCGDPSNKPGDPLTVGQEAYVAYYLCQAIDAGTDQAMTDAVVSIQKMASTTGAVVWDGKSVTIPEKQAAVVWCSNTTGAVLPNDTAFPLGQEKSTTIEYDSPNGLGNVFVIPPIGGGTTGRTFSNCENGNGAYWAVAVH